jgi:hypothetical protein
MRTTALTCATLALYLLHQDFWLWRSSGPLMFGILPPGLAYHVGFTLAAALLMLCWVRLAWPSDLEDDDR